jgi:hypothetical protein
LRFSADWARIFQLNPGLDALGVKNMLAVELNNSVLTEFLETNSAGLFIIFSNEGLGQ